jgi:hypothetical protein
VMKDADVATHEARVPSPALRCERRALAVAAWNDDSLALSVEQWHTTPVRS